MSKSKRPPHNGSDGTAPLLNRPDKIDALLKIQLETFPHKELTAAEIERWHRDLDDYRMEAIEWAFDNWRRNGNKFPVPHSILEQCEAFAPVNTATKLCDNECQSRHGKGYGENDMLWLWRKFSSVRATLNRPLTESEHQALLNELDQVRGQSPEWRTA